MNAKSQSTVKTFFRYVSLNVLSMVGLSLYVLADTFFVSNGVGENGLVALNLALPVFSLMNGAGLLLGIGGATLYSIARGEGHPERGNRVFTEVLVIGLGIGLALTLCGALLSRPIVALLGAREDVAPLADIYLKTILCFSAGFVVNNILIAFVRNDDAPRLAMAAMLTASLSNILLDYIFVYPCNMGIFGAAFATGLSPLISTAVVSLHFFRRRNRFKGIRTAFSLSEIGRTIAAGTPTFVTELSSGIIILVFNTLLLKLAGNTGVAAYGIIANVALVGNAIFNGIGQGVQPIFSLNYGAGNTRGIRQTYLLGVAAALAFGGLLYAVGAIFPNAIISVFNSENNAQLAEIARPGIRIYFLAFLGMGVNIVTTSMFACVQRPKQSFLLSLLRGFILVIPLVLLLPLALGVRGVWMALPLSEALTLAVCAALALGYFKSGRKRKAE